jgi:hypothetical protein
MAYISVYAIMFKQMAGDDMELSPTCIGNLELF